MKSVKKVLPVFLVVAAGASSCENAEVKQPNIIYIMSDDHTTQAFGVYGSRLADLNPTPTIDRIANEGILFQNAFCTNSISVPSRACIMTGQYSQTNGALDLGGRLIANKQFLAHEMNALGYETAIIGKWHLEEMPDAFSYYKVLYGQGEYFNPILAEKGSTDSINISFNRVKKMWQGKRYQGHSSDVITDQSLEWLESGRDKSKPFFLMHHFKAPHDMFEFAPRYANYLEDTFIPEPESMWDNKNNGSIATRGYNGSLMDTIGSSIGHRNIIRNMGMHMGIDKNLPEEEYKRQSYQEYLKRYLRCVKGVDDNVKRLFDYLEKEGMMDNTIIIYTGDQGFMLGEHDYIDKRWMYDESMRMPFLVRYPAKIKGGTKTNAIINNVDFAPTIIELAGGRVPEYMQGDSFEKILYTGKEPKEWKQATYYRYWMHMAHRHSNPAHFGIRTKDYKLIFFYGMDYKERKRDNTDFSIHPPSLSDFKTPVAWEFYDLKNDPFEMNNKYADPIFADVIEDLKSQLKQMRINLNEGDEKYPNIQKIIDENWD